MRLTWVILVVGCGFTHGAIQGGGGGDGGSADAPKPVDAPVIPPDARACFGAGSFQVCLGPSQLPTGGVTLPGTLNTDNAPPCLATQPTGWGASGEPPACFVVGTTITSATGKTSVTGGRPLVLLATDSISLSQDLDVSSHRGGSDGPAANSTLCGAFQQSPDNSSNGGGGGAGGSFMFLGGDGGKGDNTNSQNGQAAAADASAPTILRGGCQGQPGGNGSQNGGSGASGGGVVYLVAGNTITLANMYIDASGAGSTHGGHASGGGGGGSGGMIVLYAPQISANTVNVVANGGGASSGGDDAMAGHNGNDGNDPDPNMPTTAAPGGNGPGGNGGTGYTRSSNANSGQPGGGGQGGGGGGGGGGYIQANHTVTGVNASPNVTVVP